MNSDPGSSRSGRVSSGGTVPDGRALQSSVAPISRHTLADRVYADLKELVLSGQIPPGEKVTLRGLAAALGTSAMPVRDAIGRLVSDRALEMLPNRTVQVSWPSRERFEEIVAIRCGLEGLAASFAAIRRSAEDLREIERQAKAFDELVGQAEPDGANAITANRRLHFAIYDAAASPTLREMIEALWLQIGPVLSFSITDALDSGVRWWNAPPPGGRTEMPNVHRWHHDLVAAIAAGDADGARAAIVGDITEASTKVIQSGRLSRNGEERG